MKSSIIVLLVVYSLYTESCTGKNQGTTDKNISFTDTSQSIKPDTSINNTVFLNNPASIENAFGNIMLLLNREAAFPDAYMSTTNGKEYLRLLFFSGSSKNSISQFEVGYNADLPKNAKLNITSFSSYHTESGIKLGMNEMEIFRIKGNKCIKSEKDGQLVIKYIIDDIQKSPFLQRYNMPLYIEEYYISEGKLVKFKFGFDYP